MGIQSSALDSAAGLNRRWKYAAKIAWGYPFNYLKDVIEHTFAYTHISKKVNVATVAAVHSAIATVVAGSTTTTGFTNPDVPRVLAVTFGGTTADFAASTITIVGTNVEGKVISDVITVADNQTGQVVGTLVFKTVTSIALSKADSTGGTYSLDTSAKIGLVHRCPPSFTTAVIVQDNNPEDHPASGTTNLPVLQAAPSSSNFDNQFLEKNWVQPATAPDGTKFLYIFYWFHKAKVAPANDAPDFYSTTTSTSTSSTSTSSSTSSTSSSLSTSSTSFSSTSSSTSSTSTSTTTLPL